MSQAEASYAEAQAAQQHVRRRGQRASQPKLVLQKLTSAQQCGTHGNATCQRHRRPGWVEWLQATELPRGQGGRPCTQHKLKLVARGGPDLLKHTTISHSGFDSQTNHNTTLELACTLTYRRNTGWNLPRGRGGGVAVPEGAGAGVSGAVAVPHSKMYRPAVRVMLSDKPVDITTTHKFQHVSWKLDQITRGIHCFCAQPHLLLRKVCERTVETTVQATMGSLAEGGSREVTYYTRTGPEVRQNRRDRHHSRHHRGRGQID